MKLTCLKPRIATSTATRTPEHKQSTPEGQRGTAHERGYGHKWRKAREGWLRKHPLCVYCARDGYTNIATVVDHIVPHKGDMKLFWDNTNWQSLCAPHHNGEKKREEANL